MTKLRNFILLSLACLSGLAWATSAPFTVVPTSSSLDLGKSLQFIAMSNASPSVVTWKVNGIAGGNSTVGTVNSAGLYTAPTSLPSPEAVLVQATSTSGVIATVTARVRISAPRPKLTISPISAEVAPGGITRQFSATVTNVGDTSVVWEVNGAVGGNATAGTISAAGLYTSPAAAPIPAIVVVTARSRASRATISSAPVRIGVGATYYVSTSGSDSLPNNGTVGAPWRTIQHAADMIAPGNTVYVRGGVYYEHVTLKTSGSQTGYITFASAPGETAILNGVRPDGTLLDVPTGQNGLFTVQGNYLVVAGFELRNYRSGFGDARDVPNGIFVGKRVGTTYSNSGFDSTAVASNVYLLANHIHDIATTNPTRSSANALGIAIYGTNPNLPFSNITVLGNELDHLTTGQSESLTISGNVSGWLVQNNVIHDNNNIGFDAAGYYGIAATSDQARSGAVRGNVVSDITGYGNPGYGYPPSNSNFSAGGIYVDGGTQIVVERNIVHHADIGIEVASEKSGKTSSFVTVRSNLVYDSNANGISIGGASGAGGTDHCQVINNTLVNNTTQAGSTAEFQIQYAATSNTFKNNIVVGDSSKNSIYASSTNLADYSLPTNPVAPNYNIFYAIDGAPDHGHWRWKGVYYTTLASFKTATGNDANSVYADPLFTNVASRQLAPLAGSPARNAGSYDLGADYLGSPAAGSLDVAALTRNLGGGIDVGAYEFLDAPAPPTNLLATAGNGQVTLNWTASPAATGYAVYEGTSAGHESASAVASVSTSNVGITGLTNGTTYFFTVKSYNALVATMNASLAYSSASNETSAKPQ